MNIRFAAATDIPAMRAMEIESATAAHWSEDNYRRLLTPSRTSLVIEEEGKLLGFVTARDVALGWEIENIVVALGSRRTGLASRLLGELIDLARSRNINELRLEVRESNREARGLYEKWAFAECGRRERYYSNPEEAAILYTWSSAR